MPNSASIENSFIAGLKTEFTGLNFPEHAATDTDNCYYDLVGDVTRRLGYNNEENYTTFTTDRTNKSLSGYIWKNAGGDGTTQLMVEQIGSTLYFYLISEATPSAPISTTKLATTVDMTQYLVVGSTATIDDMECEFADGNGYLFVYHPYCETFYCSYASDTITSKAILIQIRDFNDVPDELDITTRPSTLSDTHKYNLTNHGWVSSPTWSATDTTSTVTINYGPRVFTVASGLSITVGQSVSILWNIWAYPSSPVLKGVVTGYSGTTLNVNVNWVEPLQTGYSYTGGMFGYGKWTITPFNTGYITDWFTSQGSYPSNADVWWYFKNSSGVFDPTTMVAKVTQNTGFAPRGHNILSAFNQQRSSIVPNLTDIDTMLRPRTGCWFQGRVWYAGVDASHPATGTAPFYSWTESIYFSQIITDASQFGMCYQTNDPTSEELFNLLPSDGGVIQIQGCGAIYKLFPIQNGLLVFAANGIWFITGNQGIGFTANDYTITKISSIQSISSRSFVNVMGLPYFWNEEGIYSLQPAQQGLGLTVNPVTFNSILSFYMDIPKTSKRFVRGDYDPVNYIIQWCYKSEDETDITSRYQFDKILNYNVSNKSFYPYTISTNAVGRPYIHDVQYITYPGTTTAPSPVFKYFCSLYTGGNYNFTFAEERDDNYVDWETDNYVSYFVTGYSLKGKAITKFQPTYVYMFTRNDEPTAYKIQGIWDFASDPNSNRYTTIQTIHNNIARYGMLFRRHKIRGRGLSLQLKVSSVDGLPFDLMGWTVPEQIEAGI